MQAIITKYIPCTNTRGSRIQAKCEAKTIYFGYDHSLNAEGNHVAAARELIERLGWDGEWTYGGTATGYVFTCRDGYSCFHMGK